MARRILIVDNDPQIAILTQQLMTLAGHQASHCTSAAEALRLICAADSGAYDVLITDLNLGGRGNGYIIAGAIKEFHPRAGVLLVTGFPDLENSWRAIQSFVDRILVKPVDPASLNTAVEWLAAPDRPRPAEKNLGGLIAAHRGELVELWLQKAEADPLVAAVPLPRAERIDDLEQVLEEMAARIAQPARSPSLARTEAPRRHGRVRRRQGYQATALLREASLVRQAITEMALQRFLELDPERFLADLFVMNTSVDETALQSLAAFGSA